MVRGMKTNATEDRPSSTWRTADPPVLLAARYPSEQRGRRLYVVQLLQQHVEDKGSGEGEASDDYCHVGSHRGDEVAL